MDIYLAGTQVSLTVPLVDQAGDELDVSAVEYRVIDHKGAELVARQPLADFDGSSSATIVIPASVNGIAGVPANLTSNQIDAFTVREARTVELFLTVAENTVVLNASYGLEPADALVIGVNTFQTLAQAELNAMDIPNLAGWAGAADKQKIAALIEARQHICMLSFSLLNSNVNWGQDSLNYVPEGAFQSPYAGGSNRLFMFNGNLTLLTPTQFLKLPPRFLAALCKAQVAEANAVLGGDETDERRRNGLLLEAIGDVKQMFRAGKPIDMPVSKQALRYLGQFVTLSKRIGRG